MKLNFEKPMASIISKFKTTIKLTGYWVSISVLINFRILFSFHENLLTSVKLLVIQGSLKPEAVWLSKLMRLLVSVD